MNAYKLEELNGDSTGRDSQQDLELSSPSVKTVLKSKFKSLLQNKTCGVIIFITMASFFLFGIGALFGISWGASHASSRSATIATSQYTPGDTRLHSFSSFFCRAVNLEVDNSTSASAYLVDTPPKLSDNRTAFSFIHTDLYQPMEYRYWQYYLYPNSSIYMRACSNVNNFYFSLVKGNENATTWTYFQSIGFSGSSTEEFEFGLGGSCRRFQEFSYDVAEEDEYYLIVDNFNETATSLIGTRISITRYQYEPPSNMNEATLCETVSSSSGKSRCTLDIPYSGATSSQSVLVAVSVPANVRWSEGVDLSVSCIRRDWAYAVTIICSLVVVICFIALVITSIVVFCRHYIRKLKAEYIASQQL